MHVPACQSDSSTISSVNRLLHMYTHTRARVCGNVHGDPCSGSPSATLLSMTFSEREESPEAQIGTGKAPRQEGGPWEWEVRGLESWSCRWGWRLLLGEDAAGDGLGWSADGVGAKHRPGASFPPPT